MWCEQRAKEYWSHSDKWDHSQLSLELQERSRTYAHVARTIRNGEIEEESNA